MTELRRRHPDDWMRQAHWEPISASLQGIRYNREARVPRAACAYCGGSAIARREWEGKGANKRRLLDPKLVCANTHCNRPWELVTVADPVTAINDDTGRPWDFDLQMEGVVRQGVLKRIADGFQRSERYRWEARLYVPYTLQFEGVRGRGGLRALVKWASGKWPRAGFPWSLDTVHLRVTRGRKAWADRLVRAGIIEEGDWWLHESEEEEGESSSSPAWRAP